MWTGWNQPPEAFDSVQISTAPYSGSAMQCVYPLLMTSSQVSPLIVHLELVRMKSNRRSFTPCATKSDSFHVMHSAGSTASSQYVGTELFAVLVASPRTRNRIAWLMEA